MSVLFQAFELEEILPHGFTHKFRIRRIPEFRVIFQKFLNLLNKLSWKRDSAIFGRWHIWRNDFMGHNLYYATHSVMIKYFLCVIHGVRWLRWRVITW